VCSACHSLERIAWRHLIGVTHNEAEVKQMAAEYEYTDGPNSEGEMYQRPGKVGHPFRFGVAIQALESLETDNGSSHHVG
jgi:cytochrome c1